MIRRYTTKPGITLLAAACCWALNVEFRAQEAQGRVQAGNVQGEAKVDLQTETDTETDRNRPADRSSEFNRDQGIQGSGQSEQLRRRTTHVGDMNKASGIVGMKVVNEQNEKIGSIKDVVVDLESGRISYAVLSIGGFLGLGDKEIAVPPHAFSISPTKDSLVLRADPAKLENMPGLEGNNWPDVDNPQFAASWDSNLGSAKGGADDAVRTGVGVGVGGVEPAIRGQTRIETDSQTPRIENSSRLPSDTVRQADGQVFSGRIVAIDPEKRTMTVEGESGTRQFTFEDRPVINLGKSNPNPKLVDLKVGYSVDVGYHTEGDSAVAHSVIRTDAPPTR